MLRLRSTIDASRARRTASRPEHDRRGERQLIQPATRRHARGERPPGHMLAPSPAATRERNAAPTQNRRVMSTSSAFSASSGVDRRGSSAMPQIGQRPGRPHDLGMHRAGWLHLFGAGTGACRAVARAAGEVRVAGAGCWVRRGPPPRERDGDRRGDVVHAALVRRQLQGLFADRLRTSSGSRQNRSNTSHLRARAIRRAGAPDRPACRRPDRSRMQGAQERTRRSIIAAAPTATARRMGRAAA